MKTTPKAIRRARARLLAQAEVDAGRRDISVSDALLLIIERGDDRELIIKAFCSLDDTSGQAASEKAEMERYLDAAC